MLEATPLNSSTQQPVTYDPFVDKSANTNDGKNKYLKPLLAGLAILVFVGIASLGVLISRQQEQTPGPVAPNVPASQPKAAQFNSNAIESCENIFTVVANGVAGCDSKRATTFVEQGSTIQPRDIPAGSTIQAGQTFVYWITVSAATQTTGAVTITDTLPTSITYVGPHHSNPSFVQMSHANGVVTANLGVIGNTDANRLVRVGIVVRASETIAAGRYTNNASVATTGSDVKPSSCDIYHLVNPPQEGTADCISKEAYTAFVSQNGTLIAGTTPLQVGQEFVYRVRVQASSAISNQVVVTDAIPAGLEYVNDTNQVPSTMTYDSATNTLRATIGQMTANQTYVVEFKVRVRSTASGTITNTATVLVGSTTADTCQVAHPVQVYACGTACTTNAQCQTANGDYVCHQNVCRLGTNTSSTTCQPPANTYACNTSCTTDAQCQTANSGYVCSTQYGNVCRRSDNQSAANCAPPATATPTPSPTATPAPTYSCNSPCTSNAQCATGNSNHICYNGYCRLSSNPADSSCYPVEKTQVGCNDMCNTNADCRNSNHICYTTGDGSKRCRLDNYVTSTTCNIPVVIQSTPAPTTQPQLPAELPQTGPGEWANWMKAGLVTLVVGVGLLLML